MSNPNQDPDMSYIPLAARDPARIGWAMDDLREFTEAPWSGKDAIIEADSLARVRAAGELIVKAYTDGSSDDAVPNTIEPGRSYEELEEDVAIAESERDSALEQAMELRKELEAITATAEKLDEYKGINGILLEAIDDAVHVIEKISGYGFGDNPLESVLTGLKDAYAVAEDANNTNKGQ